MKVIFLGFPKHLEWAEPVRLSSSLEEDLHHVCFLSANPDESNLVLNLQTLGGKDESGHEGDGRNQTGEMSLWLLPRPH